MALWTVAICIACLLSLAQARAAASEVSGNTPRLRALDFTPFEAALAAFTLQQEARIDTLLQRANVPDVQRAMAAGELSAEALTLYFLQRIRRHDDRLRTYLELNPRALDEARAADAQRAAGRVRSPLHGIPVSLKDNIETAAPMHTTAGAELLIDHVARRDAPIVTRLRAGGAVILGKANLSEFAGVVTLGPRIGGTSAVGGLTINPHGAPVTGGSSAGSAAGTAARLAMVSVGTETSGSLIAPAAWNGVVGMKPSRGLVGARGVVPLLRFNDSPGPIGRSVIDIAALLEVIDSRDRRYTDGLRTDALSGVAVGVLAADLVRIPGNAALMNIAAAALERAGARLQPVKLVPAPGWGDGEPFRQLLAAGVRLDMMGYVARLGLGVSTVEDLVAYNLAQPMRRAPFGVDVLASFAGESRPLGERAYRELAARLQRAAAAMLDAAFASTGAQVLVSIDNMHSMVYATAGYPAITVPLGLRAGGIPAGITLIGRRDSDARLLAHAHAFEGAASLRVEPRLP